jgi:isopentenyl diphosphate isomerase/L-lactate dehydrogenase-like FMN-dependent dehydrogenase
VGAKDRRKGKAEREAEHPSRWLSLDDARRSAKRLVGKAVWEHVRSGAGAERTLEANEAAFRRRAIWPRVLRDVGAIDRRVTVLGAEIASPVLVAPMGYHRLFDPEGELATARAAAARGTIAAFSELASVRFEAIAAATTGPKWLQITVLRDRDRTRALVERAVAAGFAAIVVTVDLPVLGRRPAEIRAGFALPAELALANHDTIGPDGAPRLATWDELTPDPRATFADLGWVRSIAGVPVVVKGVLRGEDADACVRAGASAVVVSNHGGRQLDGAPASLDALPEVAAAVAGRAEVLVDGGVRSGADVLVALALGARAVLVGRPVLHGLAAGGELGATRVLELLDGELEAAMALAGCARAADVPHDLARPAPVSARA